MSGTAAVLLVALGLAVGTFGTIVGAGGGFLLAPILLVVYPHDSPQTLTAISLAAVWINSTSGSIAYARQGRIDYRSGFAFALATLPGSVAGALLVSHVPRRLFDGVMAVVLAAVAGWLLWNPEQARRARGGVQRLVVDASGHEWRYTVPMGRGIALSVVVGFLSSFLGIGGGVFHVPILVSALGFPTHIATATSHFVLAFMSGGATLTHALQGSYRVGRGLRRSLAIGVGVSVGAQLGARVSVRVGSLMIQRLLAAALVLVAVRLGFAA